MLRDRYTFEQTKHSARIISENFKSDLYNARTTLHFLCAMVLQKFMAKLYAYSTGFDTKKRRKFNMNQKEALAFHLAYKNGCINKTCPFNTEIFTAIDRTLNEKSVA